MSVYGDGTRRIPARTLPSTMTMDLRRGRRERLLRVIERFYGELSATTIPPQTALIAVSSFEAIETIAGVYGHLPPCGSAGATVVCKDAVVSSKIVPAMVSGRIARNTIKSLLRANGGAGIPRLHAAGEFEFKKDFRRIKVRAKLRVVV